MTGAPWTLHLCSRSARPTRDRGEHYTESVALLRSEHCVEAAEEAATVPESDRAQPTANAKKAVCTRGIYSRQAIQGLAPQAPRRL